MPAIGTQNWGRYPALLVQWRWWYFRRIGRSGGPVPDVSELARHSQCCIAKVGEPCCGSWQVGVALLPRCVTPRCCAAAPGTGRLDERAAQASRAAQAHVALGQFEPARRQFQAELLIRKQLLAATPERHELQRDLSLCHSRLGDVLLALGQRAAALSEHRADLILARRLAAALPQEARVQRELSVSLNKVADILASDSEGRAALDLYREALSIRQGLLKAAPTDPQRQYDVSVSHSRIGEAWVGLGDSGAALRSFERALGVARSPGGERAGKSAVEEGPGCDPQPHGRCVDGARRFRQRVGEL